MAVAAATLGVLVAFRFAGVWPALVLTFVTGCARAIHQTARQSYAHDIAGAAGLVQALALVALVSRVGGLFGSLLIGFLIARHGSAVAYLAVAAGYLASAAAMLPPRPRAPAPHEPDGNRRGARILPPGPPAEPGPRRATGGTRRPRGDDGRAPGWRPRGDRPHVGARRGPRVRSPLPHRAHRLRGVDRGAWPRRQLRRGPADPRGHQRARRGDRRPRPDAHPARRAERAPRPRRRRVGRGHRDGAPRPVPDRRARVTVRRQRRARGEWARADG